MEKKPKYGNSPPSIRFNIDYVLEVARAKAGREISKAEVAQEIGISEAALYSILKQPKAIRLDTILKICVAYDIVPGKLFTMENV